MTRIDLIFFKAVMVQVKMHSFFYNIDQRYASMLSIIRRQMKKEKDMIENGTQLIFIGRCCERIGDHITNIAEDIYFIATGYNYMDLQENHMS